MPHSIVNIFNKQMEYLFLYETQRPFKGALYNVPSKTHIENIYHINL